MTLDDLDELLWDIFSWDNFLHAALASALLAILWIDNPVASAFVFFVFGFLREQAQHRDEGFFGWITQHRMTEAGSWGVGAGIMHWMTTLIGG